MRKCRICECTTTDACVNHCHWVSDDLCSTCADFMEILAAYMLVSGPHDHRTIEWAVTAVRRCITEVAQLPESEQPPEPLISLAKA